MDDITSAEDAVKDVLGVAEQFTYPTSGNISAFQAKELENDWMAIMRDAPELVIRHTGMKIDALPADIVPAVSPADLGAVESAIPPALSQDQFLRPDPLVEATQIVSSPNQSEDYSIPLEFDVSDDYEVLYEDHAPVDNVVPAVLMRFKQRALTPEDSPKALQPDQGSKIAGKPKAEEETKAKESTKKDAEEKSKEDADAEEKSKEDTDAEEKSKEDVKETSKEAPEDDQKTKAGPKEYKADAGVVLAKGSTKPLALSPSVPKAAPKPQGPQSAHTEVASADKCESGTYVLGKSGKAGSKTVTCEACATGKFSSGMGATECTLCAKGDFGDRPRLDECDPCPPGHECPIKGTTTPEACPKDQYAPGGSERCRTCPMFYDVNNHRDGCKPATVFYLAISGLVLVAITGLLCGLVTMINANEILAEEKFTAVKNPQFGTV
jgi:hypothetical protein